MAVNPAALSAQQLGQLQRQLEDENTNLTANYNQLKMAQQKFTDAAAVVATLTPETKGAPPRRAAPRRRPRANRLTNKTIHPASPSPLRPAGKEILVPMTSSLYVAGTLDPEERVLVDIGTSFYVGKTVAEAKELLLRKAALLRANTETLYRVIGEKRENLDAVQEELERKTGGAAR
jgi:prefoldin alpha subunit